MFMIEEKPSPTYEEFSRKFQEELEERKRRENIIKSLEGQLQAARRRGDRKKAEEARQALGKIRYGKKKESE